MNPQLDIILPCYNPPENWEQNIIESLQRLKQMTEADITLILVNDGSDHISPASIEQLRESIPGFIYVDYPGNKGKGYALRKGIECSEHEYAIYTDIDFPYTEESMTSIYNTLRSGGINIAAGVRTSGYYDQVPTQRGLLSKAFRKTIARVFRLKINDTQCGLKGFDRLGKTIFLKTSIPRYLFDLELIYLASADSRISIREVPAFLKPGIIFRSMHPGILMRESRSFLYLLIRRLFRRGN